MPGGLEKLHRLSPFLACCLSPSQLISLSLALCIFHSSLPPLLRLPLCIITIFSQCGVLFFLPRPSISISPCHSCSVASPPSCVTCPYFCLPPLSCHRFSFFFFECFAPTVLPTLPMWLMLEQRDGVWSTWVLFVGHFSAKRSVLRRVP